MGDESENHEYRSGRGFTIRKNNSSATVHLFGATLISWIADGREVLFFSKKAVFTCDEIITGGVPVIFPQFGPWEKDYPQHGFARISTWTLSSKKSDSLTLVLKDSPITRLYWNYKFNFEYTLALIDDVSMKIDITIHNPGDEAFPFSFLLHNYFSVADIHKSRLSGLKGCRYINKVKNGEQQVEDSEEVAISEYTDRIYYNTRVIHRLRNATSSRDIVIEKMNLPDTIVWNPWKENAKLMKDFGDDEWKSMVCVASGYFNPPAILEPNETFIASQILSVENCGVPSC